jgi:hypothetical protein
MKQDIKYALLQLDEIADFQVFIHKYWGENHIFTKDISVFDWQHKGKNFYHAIIAKNNEKIIGTHCLIPLNHFDDNLPSNEIFLALWRVAEGNGIGIGLKLFETIKKEYEPEFIFSLGINSRAVPFHKWQKFDVVGDMNHHVIVNPNLQSYKIAEIPDSFVAPPVPEFSGIDFIKLDESRLRQLSTEHLYACQFPTKSDNYIINRFIHHPIYHYDVYAAVYGNVVDAICVVRKIQIESATVLRMVDYFGENKAFPKIGPGLTQLLKAQGAEYLDLYSYGIPGNTLEEAGFVNRHTTAERTIPNYFEPFTKQNIEVKFAFKAEHDKDKVRLFKADGDQDRPSRL